MENLTGLALVVVVSGGIAEAIKRALFVGSLEGLKRYVPVISVVVGVGVSFIISDVTALQGVVAGLIASGLYSGGKAIVGK